MASGEGSEAREARGGQGVQARSKKGKNAKKMRILAKSPLGTAWSPLGP